MQWLAETCLPSFREPCTCNFVIHLFFFFMSISTPSPIRLYLTLSFSKLKPSSLWFTQPRWSLAGGYMHADDRCVCYNHPSVIQHVGSSQMDSRLERALVKMPVVTYEDWKPSEVDCGNNETVGNSLWIAGSMYLRSSVKGENSSIWVDQTVRSLMLGV